MPRQPLPLHLLIALLLASTIPAPCCSEGECGSGDQPQQAAPPNQQECALASGGGGTNQPLAPGAMLAVRPCFMLLGDSLTQRGFDEGGWGAMLASAYQRKVRLYYTCGSTPGYLATLHYKLSAPAQGVLADLNPRAQPAPHTAHTTRGAWPPPTA